MMVVPDPGTVSGIPRKSAGYRYGGKGKTKRPPRPISTPRAARSCREEGTLFFSLLHRGGSCHSYAYVKTAHRPNDERRCVAPDPHLKKRGRGTRDTRTPFFRALYPWEAEDPSAKKPPIVERQSLKSC